VHSLDTLVNAVLMTGEVSRKVTALGQAQTGASPQQIDDPRTASGDADNPIYLIRWVVRPVDGRNDDLGILGAPRQPNANPHALILAEMAGDFGHQQVAEQTKVSPLLFRRGDAPEAARQNKAMTLTSTVSSSITCCNLRRFSCGASPLFTIATNFASRNSLPVVSAVPGHDGSAAAP
jgi:hypothetical protein